MGAVCYALDITRNRVILWTVSVETKVSKLGSGD